MAKRMQLSVGPLFVLISFVTHILKRLWSHALLNIASTANNCNNKGGDGFVRGDASFRLKIDLDGAKTRIRLGV